MAPPFSESHIRAQAYTSSNLTFKIRNYTLKLLRQRFFCRNFIVRPWSFRKLFFSSPRYQKPQIFHKLNHGSSLSPRFLYFSTCYWLKSLENLSCKIYMVALIRDFRRVLLPLKNDIKATQISFMGLPRSRFHFWL